MHVLYMYLALFPKKKISEQYTIYRANLHKAQLVIWSVLGTGVVEFIGGGASVLLMSLPARCYLASYLPQMPMRNLLRERLQATYGWLLL